MDDSVVRLKLLLDSGLTTPFLQTKKTFNNGSDEMRGKLDDFKASQKNTFKSMADEIPGASRAIALLTNPLIAAGAGLAAIGTGMYSSIKGATDWADRMAHANVTAQLSKKELNGLSDQLLEIGSRSYGNLNDVPDAFNRILSANVSVNDALKATEPTLRAAKAGWTDIVTTADAGVGVMKASGEDINRVYDVLLATVNKGKAELVDVAQYLPKVIPSARQAGLQLYETAGAWAYLTATGQKTEHATRLLENGVKVLSQLDKVHAFKKMGVEIYGAEGKIKPLSNIIDQLTKRTKGLTDLGKMRYFNKIGMDIEASSFFAALTKDAKELRSTIDFVKQSQGQLNESFKNAVTPLDDWKKAINEIKVESVELGEAFLPILAKIGHDVAEIISKIPGMLRSFEENKIFAEKGGEKRGTDYINFIKEQFGKGIKTESDLNAAMGKALKWANTLNTMKDAATIRENNASIFFGDGSFNDLAESKIHSVLKNATFGLWKKPLGARSSKEIIAERYGFAPQNYIGERSAIINSMKSLPLEFIKYQRDQKANSKKIPVYGGDPNGKEWDQDKKKLRDTTDHIAGTAKQIHNITVNIDSFNKGGINTQNTSLQKMDARQIEDWFTQAMLRMIRNLEMSYT